MNGFKKRFTRLLVVLMLMFYHVPVLAAPPGAGADIEVKIDKFDIATSFDVVYNWTLDKSVDDNELFLHVGDSQTVNYTVAVTRTLTSTFSITYTISIENKGPGTAKFMLGALIANPSGSTVYASKQIEDDPVEVTEGTTFSETYTTTFQINGLAADLDPLKIAAVITELNNSLDDVKHGTSPSINFSDNPTGTYNSTLVVTDSFTGVGPWTFTDTGSVTYQRIFTASALSTVVYDNTVTSDTLQKVTPTVLSDTVSVSVTGVNSLPVADDKNINVAEGGTVGGSVTASDSDNDPLTFELVSGPMYDFSFTFNPDGTFSYTHDGSENHSDSFTFKVSDGFGYSNTATVNITVDPVNDAPTADDDSFTVDEGNTHLGNVTASDPENDTLTYILVDGPLNGFLIFNPDGSFSYEHDGSETTSDSFTFKVYDGALYSNTATVTITINPVNDAPVANDDSFTGDEGGTITDFVTGSDAENDPLTFILVSGPMYAASFTLNPDGTFTYVHDGSENHSDGFTFKVNDGSVDSNVATVVIALNAVNDAPEADDDSFTIDEGAVLNGNVTGSDPDGDSLTYVLVSGPMYYTSFILNPDGSFVYDHDGSETMQTTFTFKAYDGFLYSEEATITINITPVNDAPVADDDVFTLDEGATLNDWATGSDAENDPLTFILVSGPSNAASFTLNPDGSFTYVHDGSETVSDSFTFKVNDGELDSNVATISLTITPVNEAPTADDDSFTVDEGGTENGTATGSDPDGDTLTYILVDGPSYADYFEFNPDGSYVYTHDGSENFSDSFTFKVSDGLEESAVATITITINPVNDAPVADDDDFTLDEGATLNENASGSDAENDPLTFILVDDVQYGTLTLNPDGSFEYIHDGSENFSDSFTFKVNDGEYDSNVATITLTITPVNDTPTANDDGFAVNEGGTYDGTATGSDPDGDDLEFILVSDVVYGTLTFNADGTFTYIHDDSENFSDSFTFKVNDGTVDSNVATIDILINPVNEGPTAADSAFTVLEGGTHIGNLIGEDPDGPILQFVLVDDVTEGTLVFNANGTYTYTHDGGPATADSFTFSVTDGQLTSGLYTVAITITQLNAAPISTPDAVTVDEGGFIEDRVNGTDPDGDPIIYILVGDVTNGTLILNANGTYRYDHNGSETTADSFSYRVSDGRRLSAISVVTITINPVNEAPVAVNGELETEFETAVNGSLVSLISDVDSTTFAYILVTDVQNGTLTLNADGTFTYTPDAGFDGEDSFTFKANDGELDSNVATFTITVAEEVIIIDPETPQAPLNYWWLMLLPLLLLLLFLRPNLKYELVDAQGNKKTIRRHIFAKGDEDLFVDLNDKDMKDLVHVDLTVYKQLVKREQGRKITFNLFKKPMKTIEVPEDMKDAIKDRIEL
jgi:VCBS repeat-containing protein